MKVALFLYCIGPEVLKIYNDLSFETSEQKGTLEHIITKFDEFTIGQTNEYEHYILNSRNQATGKSVYAYSMLPVYIC